MLYVPKETFVAGANDKGVVDFYCAKAVVAVSPDMLEVRDWYGPMDVQANNDYVLFEIRLL